MDGVTVTRATLVDNMTTGARKAKKDRKSAVGINRDARYTTTAVEKSFIMVKFMKCG